MVRIVAALAWYAEPVPFLERLVESLAGVVDTLVAIDGRWDLFPGGEPSSSDEEILAIEEASARVGLDLVMESDGVVWRSQVAKRDYLLEAAAGEHADWILIVDGDEFVTHAEPETLRAELAATELNVALAMTVPQNVTWPYRDLPTNPRPVRRIFRAGTRMPGPAHNAYRFGDEWLMGDLAHVMPADALDLSAQLHVAHDNRNRGKERNLAAKEYRRARRERRVEAWR